MTIIPGVLEIANPASVGWEFDISGGTGRAQIAWPRDTDYLIYAYCPTEGPTAGQWSSAITMARPRWEVSPRTLKRAREVVREFIAEGSREETVPPTD